MPLKQNDIVPYARDLKNLISLGLDMQEELVRLANAIDFDTEQWEHMFKKHRPLAQELSAIAFKYAAK